MTTNLTSISDADLNAELVLLGEKHRKAGGLGMQVLNLVGGQAENLLERLPDSVKDRLEEATLMALKQALSIAQASRKNQKDPAPWVNTLAATAMGAAGGLGGAPTALVELPITTTVLLRAIQGVAQRHGFDPQTPEVQAECLKVFASGGPLSQDDGSDTAFLAARMTLTGGSVQAVLTKIAPRLATVLGQKLGAQAVPILGAASGAAINYAYTSYYQEMADIHFRLLILAQKSGRPEADILAAFAKTQQPKK
ncbi:EcsC family protein [Algirhabdus cladophorae]|uniref:EcsC family protein n=1 Tax=Algirhabdus cladophorae TaxID=3377108 RepID=UPI003B84A042